MILLRGRVLRADCGLSTLGRVFVRAADRRPNSRPRRRTRSQLVRPLQPSRRRSRLRWFEAVAEAGRGSWRAYVATTDAYRTCRSRPLGRCTACRWCGRVSVSYDLNCLQIDVHNRRTRIGTAAHLYQTQRTCQCLPKQKQNKTTKQNNKI